MHNIERLLKSLLKEQEQQTQILQSIEKSLKDYIDLTDVELSKEIGSIVQEFNTVHSINPEKIYLLAVAGNSFGAQSMTLKKLLISL